MLLKKDSDTRRAFDTEGTICLSFTPQLVIPSTKLGRSLLSLRVHQANAGQYPAPTSPRQPKQDRPSGDGEPFPLKRGIAPRNSALF